jgi:hypothetical protein
MRKSLRAFVLMLALCAPAFAGDIPNPPGLQPPPPSQMVEGQTTDDEGEPGATGSLTETILAVLQTALALL